MTRIIRAELLRLLRPRTILIMSGAVLAFAVIAATAVFEAAVTSGPVAARGGTSIRALADSGGGTEAFAVGASFVGFLVFVIFIGLMAAEFSGGTFRALLLRDPHRLRLVVGKLVAALIVAAGALVLAEALTFVVSLLVAPSRDVDTSPWFSLDAVGHALADLGTVFGGVAGWAVLGTMLAVVFRSTPLALAVGFAWAGPLENITVDSWSTGYRVFPGQVMAAVIQGGTPEVSLTRAAITGCVYAGIAAMVAMLLLTRRDVTS